MPETQDARKLSSTPREYQSYLAGMSIGFVALHLSAIDGSVPNLLKAQEYLAQLVAEAVQEKVHGLGSDR